MTEEATSTSSPTPRGLAIPRLALAATFRTAFASIKRGALIGTTLWSIGVTSEMSREQKRNYMSYYEDTAVAGNGSFSTPSTPPSGSTPSDWAERLQAKYGIAQPMAPEDGLDEEHEHLAAAVAVLG